MFGDVEKKKKLDLTCFHVALPPFLSLSLIKHSNQKTKKQQENNADNAHQCDDIKENAFNFISYSPLFSITNKLFKL